MAAREVWPRALFGGPLQGDNLAKQVNIDESGRSAREPVVVVAGVLVDVDKEFALAEQRVAQAIENVVPEHLRDGFIFHAKDVFGKLKKQEGWDWSDCNRIIDEWIQVALDLRLPVVVSWRKKTATGSGRYTMNNIQHAVAFANCFQGADDFMRRHHHKEAATVIAEDCPEMRNALREAVKKVTSGEWMQIEKIAEQGFDHEITNIKGGVLFAQKDDTPALQIADAYAFAFMRYVNRRPGGDRLWHRMNGGPGFSLHRDVHAFPGNGQLVLWNRHRPALSA